MILQKRYQSDFTIEVIRATLEISDYFSFLIIELFREKQVYHPGG